MTERATFLGADDIWRRHMALDGPTLSVEIERDPSVVVSQPGRTFSTAAMESVADELALWIGTRCMRAMDRGQIPRRMVVRVHVELDGAPAE